MTDTAREDPRREACHAACLAGATVRALAANDPYQAKGSQPGHNTHPHVPAGNSPATAAERTSGTPPPEAPFAALLRGVTSKHRGHRGQLAETGLSPCPDSLFLSPVRPGTSPRTPGTPGTTHSSKVHGSAGNRPRPLCLVLGARPGGHVQREASPRHRRPSAARNPWAMGQGQPAGASLARLTRPDRRWPA